MDGSRKDAKAQKDCPKQASSGEIVGEKETHYDRK
jgi:hypothetical protein